MNLLYYHQLICQLWLNRIRPGFGKRVQGIFIWSRNASMEPAHELLKSTITASSLCIDACVAFQLAGGPWLSRGTSAGDDLQTCTGPSYQPALANCDFSTWRVPARIVPHMVEPPPHLHSSHLSESVGPSCNFLS